MKKWKLLSHVHSLWPHRLYSPWNSLDQHTAVGSPSPGGLPNSAVKPRSPTLQVDSLPAEPQGKSDSVQFGFLCIYVHIYMHVCFPGSASGKETACQFRRHKRCRFNPWVGKVTWEGNGSPLQYSCLENPMDRGVWWAIVHRVTKSWTRLKWLSTKRHTHVHLHIFLQTDGSIQWVIF